MEAQLADVLRVRLLGGFEASSGERQVPAGGWRLRKAKTLVKLLALEPAHTMHVEQASDALWPDHDGAAARNNLHQAVYAARRALSSLDVDGASVITLHDDLLAFGSDVDVVVDVHELRAEVRRAAAAGDVDRVTALLHESPPDLLPEDAYEPWLQPHAAAFREWRAQAVLDVADKQTDDGAAEQAVVMLAPVVTADPLNEPATRALMRALAASGRRSEALVVYERLRHAVQEELGSDPESETRALFRDLLTGSTKQATGRARPAIPAQRPGGNMPAPMSSLVGRSRELDEMSATLGRTRLLTLTGMGGVGKTTLAISLARRAAADYRDGAYLVELAAVRDGDQVAAQIAGAMQLALPSDSSAVDAIVAQLRMRNALIVLDNCEHLLDACAPVVSALLRGCADLRVVATSREPLRVEGEVSWRVPSLALPDRDCTDQDELLRAPSVDLFVQRAAAASPGFTLTPDNAEAVTAICYRLDGIPLALELAAACVPSLAPTQIAERLSDAMTLLRRGDRALTRQQTLEATLTWSHDLLTHDEQTLFRRLGIFADSFTLDAAEAVCAGGLPPGAVVSALARLVDTSLVVADMCEEATRYRLLETVRQYAVRRLRASRELSDVERRHCRWYADLAVAHDPELVLLATFAPAGLDVEHGNLRTALTWSLHHDPPVALQLAVSLWRYWLARGFLAEGRRWLEAALAAAPAPTPDRARGLVALAAFDVRRGTGERLPALGAEAVAIHRTLGDQSGLAQSLCASAIFAFLLGEWHDCWQRTVDARAVAERSGAPDLEISAAHLQGIVRAAQGRLHDARAAYDEARELLPWVGDAPRPFLRPVSTGFAVETGGNGDPRVYFEETVLHGRIVGPHQADAHLLCNIADVARAAGDLDEALLLARRAEDIFTMIGDVDGHAVALSRRGCLHRVRGEYDLAREALTQSLQRRRLAGERRAVALGRTNLALLLAAEGDVDSARRAIEAEITRASDIRDVAGQFGLSLTLASVEAEAGDDAQALAHVQNLLATLPGVPGGTRPHAWALVLHACLAHRLGHIDVAAAARDDAQMQFTEVGAVDGVVAVDRLDALQSRR